MKEIVLSNREEMMERLRKIEGSEALHSRLFPRLQEHAGKTLSATAFAWAIARAIHDDTGGQVFLMRLLLVYVDDIVDALVDDRAMANQVKQLFPVG